MLWIAVIVLALLSIGLTVKVILLRKAAKEIEREFADRLTYDTNTLITLSCRDRRMCALASGINRELRKLRRERNRFQQGDWELKKTITNISHDLRTPLTAICGYLELLKRGATPEKAAQYLQRIEERTEALKRLTEELFSYSICVSKERAIEYERVDLNRMLEENIASHYAALTERGIVPELSLPERRVIRNLNSTVLSRIFSNLISNALKYSGGDLLISLSETGEILFSNEAPTLDGIQVGKLFDRFYTVETAQHATGLGLAITRTLTEQMGGEISATYRENRLQLRLYFPAEKE